MCEDLLGVADVLVAVQLWRTRMTSTCAGPEGV